MFNHIVMVCSANICRSPYAEYKLKQLTSGITVNSAGVSTEKYGFDGLPAESAAINIAHSRNIDLSSHTAKQLTLQHIDNADLLLAMNRDHIERIAILNPKARHKTFLLGHWVGIKNIIDPFNQHDDIFELAFSQIDIALKSWAKKLNRDQMASPCKTLDKHDNPPMT